MRRRTTPVAGMIALVALAVLDGSASAQSPPPPTAPVDPGRSVRVLDPTVRTLEPVVRALREERVDGPTTTVTISSDVLFDFGSAAVTDAARRVVDDTGTRLAATPGAVTVVGHTDSIGDQASNQALSEARARAVAEQLGTTLGVRPVETAGRSFLEPVAPNERNGEDNPAGRALNRRVVITVRS